MSYINVCTKIDRSNPAIIRQIQIDFEANVADMLKAIAIAYGLGDFLGECYADNIEINPDCKLEDLTDVKNSGVIFLYNGIEKKQCYRIVWDIRTDIPLLKENTAENNLPFIVDYVGMNLPAEVYDIKEINYIQRELDFGHNVYMKDGNVYTDVLFPTSSKMENAMRRYFAPATAKREVNRKNCIPFVAILNKFTVQKLRVLTDQISTYVYSNPRKVDYIDAILRKYNAEYIRGLFWDINLSDYYIFRSIAFSETVEELKSLEISKPFMDFLDFGFFTFDTDGKPLIATELLEYIDYLYNSGLEESFIKKKNLQRAARICGNYYSVFGKNIFEKVVEITKENDIDKDIIVDFYSDIEDRKIYGINNFRHDAFNAYNMISDKTASELWKVMSHEMTDYYVPSKEELLIYENSLHRFSEKNTKRLFSLISEYGLNFKYDLYDEGGVSEIYASFAGLINRVRSSYTKSNMMEYIKKIFRTYYINSNMQKQLCDEVYSILEEESKCMPLIIYGGYSANNCPKEIKVKADKKLAKVNAERKNNKNNTNIKNRKR